MKITENFEFSEFECKCGCGLNIISFNLVHRLQVIRDITGLGMVINSGCRCPIHNKNEGGKGWSYHLKGMGADWYFDTQPKMLKRVCTQLIPNWSGGIHYYEDRGFCHSDIGPRRRW